MPKWACIACCSFLLLCCALPCAAQSASELADMDLEQLLDVEVVTASRRPETATLAAAAITVLTEEDIRRSGTTTLPDLLRRVPSLKVYKEDTDSWSVGTRGFSGLRNSMFLVLVDGRPVTSPSLSGVIWSSQTVPLETIERVEIIRGACTSLWGLDSFNGVVNVITKRAEDAQKELSVTTAGTTSVAQHFFAGGGMGESGYWRGSVGGAYADGREFSGQQANAQYWKRKDADFRMDFTTSETDEMSLQGALHMSSVYSPAPGFFPGAPTDRESYSGHMQLVWDHATGLGTGVHLRTSYTRGRESLGDMEGVSNVADLEAQYSLRLGEDHHLVMGTGGRYIWDDFTSGNTVQSDTARIRRMEWNGFVQDRMHLPPDGLDLILGIKMDKAGAHLEMQPTARLLYDRGSDVWWGGVSRSERSSDRYGRTLNMDVMVGGTRYTLSEGEGLESEKLLAWELGWRHAWQEVSSDLVFFVNDYSDMLAVRLDDVGNNAVITNDLDGTTYGLEYTLAWQLAEAIRLSPSLTWLHHDWEGGWLDNRGGYSNPATNIYSGQLKVGWDVTRDLLADMTLYHDYSVDDREFHDTSLDASLQWRAHEDLTVDFMVTNVLGNLTSRGGRQEDPVAMMRVTWGF